MKKKRKYIKPVYKYFVFYFLPIFVILIIALLLIISIQIDNKKKLLWKNEKVYVKLMWKITHTNLQSIFSDLLVLAYSPELQQMLNYNSQNIKMLEEAFLVFSRSKTIYDQVRFLDSNGMEQVRINYNNGSPVVVKNQFLQNKFKRYYFKDTFMLQKGKIFVSPFDLNIEKGEIEKPLKPMIRIGTPVFDSKNRKRGIVLLNYFGILLKDDLIAVYKSQPGVLMILNSNGYWIKGKKSADEWGFMYADKKDLTMGKKYPEAWEIIKDKEAGQFICEYGLFTYKTIHPLKVNSTSSDGSGVSFSKSKKIIKNDEYHWKIVTHLSNDKIDKLYKNIYYTWLPSFLIPILIHFFISWYLAKSRVIKNENEELIHESLKEKELLLKEIHHRVKNSLNMVYNMLNLQLFENDDVRFGKIVADVQSRLLSIGKIHEKLYSSQDLVNIDFKEYIKDLFEMLLETFKADSEKISINFDIDPIKFNSDTAIPLGLILAELFTNSLKYAFSEIESCEIKLSLKTKEDLCFLVFSDNGKGFEFGFSFEDRKSFGLKLVDILVNQLKGKLEFVHDNGARFIITFPK